MMNIRVYMKNYARLSVNSNCSLVLGYLRYHISSGHVDCRKETSDLQESH